MPLHRVFHPLPVGARLSGGAAATSRAWSARRPSLNLPSASAIAEIESEWRRASYEIARRYVGAENTGRWWW